MSRGALRFGYGMKLAVGAILLVLVVGLVVLVIIDRTLEGDMLADLDVRLEVQARGAATWVVEGQHPERLAERLARIIGARVTILDARGLVLGDSNGTVRVGKDESRAPEVFEALSGRVGRISRVDPTGETRYLALPVGPGMVLRIAAALQPIHATLARVRARLAIASTLGLLLAVALSYVGSRIAAHPLRAMRNAAQRIAEGNYDISLTALAPDEFGELERSLSVLAKRLEQDRARIERLEATRRDFVANVSHELRTPITAIRGYAETLLAGAVDEKTARVFLETMHRQAKRVSVLVADLLRLSEAEARMPEDVHLQHVRLADLAREAVATACEAHDDIPQIRIEIPDDVVVLGDSAALEQVLENLIENAIRYGRRNDADGSSAEVRVAAHLNEERVIIRVSDDGPGIAKEHLPRIFERFYRGDGKSQGNGGTGLGLAIVKHLVESMGGSVGVENGSDRGATFFVELASAREGSLEAPRQAAPGE